MKPNCTNCNKLFMKKCPLYHPFKFFKTNFPFSLAFVLIMVENSTVVCDVYEKISEQKKVNEK